MVLLRESVTALTAYKKPTKKQKKEQREKNENKYGKLTRTWLVIVSGTLLATQSSLVQQINSLSVVRFIGLEKKFYCPHALSQNCGANQCTLRV